MPCQISMRTISDSSARAAGATLAAEARAAATAIANLRVGHPDRRFALIFTGNLLGCTDVGQVFSLRLGRFEIGPTLQGVDAGSLINTRGSDDDPTLRQGAGTCSGVSLSKRSRSAWRAASSAAA